MFIEDKVTDFFLITDNLGNVFDMEWLSLSSFTVNKSIV